jgi:hypothetical protein
MPTRTLRRARIVLLALMLGILCAGLAGAQRAPMSKDWEPGKSCAPAMSTAAPQAEISPVIFPCQWAIYEEWYQNGVMCRYGDSCSGDWYGTCPGGYHTKYREYFECC